MFSALLPALAALALLGAGFTRRWSALVPVVSLVGVAAGAAAGPLGVGNTLSLGLSVTLDPLSGLALVALLLPTAAGAIAPLPAGAATLLILAGDAATLSLAGAGLAAAGPANGALPGRSWIHATLLGLLLAAAGVLSDFRVGALLPFAVVAAAATAMVLRPAAGGAVAVYLVARLLLQAPGAVIPGWWSAPVLLLGAAAAVLAARRAGAAITLSGALHDVGTAMAGLSLLGLGAALLARGSDLLSTAGLAATGAGFLVLTTALATALLALCAPALAEHLSRGGGAMRRAPLAGLAAATGLASLAAVPATPGFAGIWLVVEGLLGAGRGGGVAVLLLVAGAVAVTGWAAALAASAVLRLAGMLLLGAPRSAPPTAARPAGARRILLALGATAIVLTGVVPGLPLLIAGPAAAQLAPGTGVAGTFGLGLPEMPGYRAASVAAILLALLAAGLRAARGPEADPVAAIPWNGGFAEDGVGRDNLLPASTVTNLPRPEAGPVVLGVLLLLLAGLIGWAAR